MTGFPSDLLAWSLVNQKTKLGEVKLMYVDSIHFPFRRSYYQTNRTHVIFNQWKTRVLESMLLVYSSTLCFLSPCQYLTIHLSGIHKQRHGCYWLELNWHVSYALETITVCWSVIPWWFCSLYFALPGFCHEFAAFWSRSWIWYSGATHCWSRIVGEAHCWGMGTFIPQYVIYCN